MKLLIYGSGGFGREVYDLACRINNKENRWSDISFIDDIREEKLLNGIKIYKFEEILSLKDIECIVALGEPVHREKLYNRLVEHNIKITTLIDPTAVVSKSAIIAEGCIICALSLIANNVQLKENVVVQPMSNVGHDIIIGKHSVLSSNVSPGGGDIFGDKVYVGMGAIIKEKLNIGDNSIIGMGSCVFNDIPPDVIALGNPARPMRRNEEQKIFK
jgi:sugar O-acyltransferase (sialic acid O-acetyltransferase NeuD family)